MTIIPAIDLKDGKCVRLVKGDFSTAHEVASDPYEVALDFKSAGASLVHTVDLDGALLGERRNAEIIRKLAGIDGIRLQMGGGIRSMKDLDAVSELGVWRMVIGTAAVGNLEFVREAVFKYKERVAIGIDALDSKVRTRGWTDDSGLDAFDFAKDMAGAGVDTIIFTDIATDGTLSGPPIDSLARLVSSTGCNIIASGGVSCMDDLVRLSETGVSGVIVGKAYYTGAVDLKRAIDKFEHGGRNAC